MAIFKRDDESGMFGAGILRKGDALSGEDNLTVDSVTFDEMSGEFWRNVKFTDGTVMIFEYPGSARFTLVSE